MIINIEHVKLYVKDKRKKTIHEYRIKTIGYNNPTKKSNRYRIKI